MAKTGPIRLCAYCGTSFQAWQLVLPPGQGLHCSRRCGVRHYWADKERLPDRYSAIRQVRHPLANSRGDVPAHRLALYGVIGGGSHACHWCGIEVTWNAMRGTSQGNLTVDHVDSNPRNNAVENLVPSCHRCNTKRMSTKILDTEDTITLKNGFRTRAVRRICVHCGKTFLALPSHVAHGGGRFCSPACFQRSRSVA